MKTHILMTLLSFVENGMKDRLMLIFRVVLSCPPGYLDAQRCRITITNNISKVYNEDPQCVYFSGATLTITGKGMVRYLNI